MLAPPHLDLVDDSRRFAVQLRARSGCAIGPYEFDATGRVEARGGGELRRFLEAMRPDIESVAEIVKAPAARSVVESSACFETMPDDATTAPVDRNALAGDLHASGLSWRQVGEKMGIAAEAARALARRGAKHDGA